MRVSQRLSPRGHRGKKDHELKLRDFSLSVRAQCTTGTVRGQIYGALRCEIKVTAGYFYSARYFYLAFSSLPFLAALATAGGASLVGWPHRSPKVSALVYLQ